MKYRGFGDPTDASSTTTSNEYSQGVWEHGITYTTVPGTEWEWPRCHAVGGKTNFWGRSAARFGDIDFKASQPGRLRRGLADHVQGDRALLQPRREDDRRGEHGAEPAEQSGRRVSPGDAASLPRLHPPARLRKGRRAVSRTASRSSRPRSRGPPQVPLLRGLHEGCDTGSFFSTPFFLIPPAEKTGKLDCARTRWRRTCSWTRTGALRAWPTSTATRSRRSRCTPRRSSSRLPASRRRGSC